MSNRRRVRHLAGGVLVALALIIPAACGGSTLSPSYVQRVNGQGGSSGPNAANAGTDGTGSDNTAAGKNDTPGALAAREAAVVAPARASRASRPVRARDSRTRRASPTRRSRSATPPTSAVRSPDCSRLPNRAPRRTSPTSTRRRASAAASLQLTTLDSRTDAGADQQAYSKLCETVFAAVGSMSAFDSGGAATAQKCGLPDIRTAAVTATRNACSTCFGAQATGIREFSNAVPDFFVKNYKAASQKAAFLYLNAGAAAENAATQQKIETRRGMKFVYSVGHRRRRVQLRALRPADEEQGSALGPVHRRIPAGCSPGAGHAVGELQAGRACSSTRPSTTRLRQEWRFSRRGRHHLHQLHSVRGVAARDQPLQAVAPAGCPGAAPTFFGLFAWSAAKLFVAEVAEPGRQAHAVPSLVAKVKGVHAWTADGAHGPMDVGGKHSPSCVRFLQLRGGKWVPLKGTAYVCHGAGKAVTA